MSVLLDLLPDDILATIVHEWINTQVTLCSFDSSLCNKLLRTRYIKEWKSTVANNMHFKLPNYQDASRNELFYNWCEKREICPVLLTCFSTKKQKVLSSPHLLENIERMTVYYNLNCDDESTVPTSVILNSCPNLKYWEININWVKNEFHFECGPYQLIHLEFSGGYFPLCKVKQLVKSCPLLEVVKIGYCNDFGFAHINHLIDHAPRIRSISMSQLFLLRSDESEYESSGAICSTMRCFKVGQVHGTSTSILEQLLAIFQKCPLLEEVFVPDCTDCDLEVISNICVDKWCAMISRCWEHVYSLEVSGCQWLLNNVTLFNTLVNCCAKGLKTLRISNCDINDNHISKIASDFASLNTLEFSGSHTIRNISELTQRFQLAKFRNTLHTFKFNIIDYRIVVNVFLNDNDVEDDDNDDVVFVNYSDWLTYLPALKNITLQICSKRAAIVTPFPGIEQIEEMKIEFFLKRDKEEETDDGEYDEDGAEENVEGILEELPERNDNRQTDYLLEAAGKADEASDCSNDSSILSLFRPEIMSGFANLKKLAISGIPPVMTALLMRSILTLPHLRIFSFGNRRNFVQSSYVVGNADISLFFHPDNYPSDPHLLCPLKEFSYTFSKDYFPEDMLRIFLQRFSSLELFKTHSVAMTKAAFGQLRNECRYRVAIKANEFIKSDRI